MIPTGWTTPRTWVAAETPSAATFNTHIRDNLNYLYQLVHMDQSARVPGATWTTTSSSFVDWNGATPLTLAFTKRGGTETHLRVDINTTGFLTGGNGKAQLGIRVGSTDYQNSFPHFFNTPDDHRHMGETIRITGLAAGAYTLKLRVSVTANTFNVDTNDFAQIVCQEVVA